MANSKTEAGSKPRLQFSYYDSTLPIRLAADIRRSSFTTRSQCLNALLEKVLSWPVRTSTSSHIDEFFVWMELFESLPIERIGQLAPTQNRNFDQMIKHLLEIALSHYPENSQTSAVASDINSHQVEAHQPGLADHARFPDRNYRRPAARNHVS